MSLTNDQLLNALGTAIRSADQGGNTTAADLRGFLTQLLGYIQQDQDGTADQLTQKEQVGVAEGLVATERTRLDGLLNGTADTLAANSLAANTYLIGENKRTALTYDDSRGELRVGTYDNNRITFSATDYEFFTKSYNRLSLRLHSDGTVYVVNNLGVGTYSPTERVEVIGNVKADKFIGDGSQLTNLPSSSTVGCVHLTGDEGVDGHKTFLQTLTVINSDPQSETLRFIGTVDSMGSGNVMAAINTSGKNWKNQFSFQNQEGELWAFGNDGDCTGEQNFFIYDGLADEIRFFIDDDGNTGVGKTNPTERLEIEGNVKAQKFIGDGSQLTNLPTGPTVIVEQNLSSNSTTSVPSVAAIRSALPASTDSVTEGNKNLYFTTARTLASTLTGYAKSSTNRAITTSDSILASIGLLEKQVADVKILAQTKQYGIFTENYANINDSRGLDGAYRLLGAPGSEKDYMTLYAPLPADAGVMAQVVCNTGTSIKTSRLTVQYIPVGTSTPVIICTLAPGETALCAVVTDTSNKAKWVLFAKERSASVVDPNATTQAIKSAVKGGSFSSGELQGTQPTGSVVGMRFVDSSYRYEYMTGAADTNGTGYVWVRTAKV